MSVSRRLDIGVVGGSLAGCFAALELLAAGHRVTVFEASDAELHGLLGAGLGTPTPTFATLVERGLVDGALPHVRLEDMLFVGLDPHGGRRGRVALRRSLMFVAFHWTDLHRGLRARMPASDYRAGVTVDSVSQPDPDHALVCLADGAQHPFDLVVCADGYRSQSRHSLFADVRMDYRGYVCWRGVVPEDRVNDADSLRSDFVRLGTKGLPGSFLYPVPGQDGRTGPGERLINWGCYLPVQAADLADFLVARDGRHHDGAIPPGEMEAAQEGRLKAIARESLPPLYADIVQASEGTFAQAIYSLVVPAYRRGRICLTGDAGALAPPFTGSGIFKAATNAITLRTALDAHDDIDAALGAWDARETAAARELVALGAQYENAFIANHPDLTHMNSAEAGEWWASVVHHPPWFTFEVD